MSSIEGIQRMAVHQASALQHSTDSDAIPVSDPTALHVWLPGTLQSRRRNALQRTVCNHGDLLQ